tara:strand:+ start:17919 stop:19985 length:2067 start_codon:yes stop_codon:yes gene_type:complete
MKSPTKLILIGSISKINLELFDSISLNYPDIFIGPEVGIFSHPLLWKNFKKFKDISIDTNYFNISEKYLNKAIKNGINPYLNLLDDQLNQYNISKKDILNCISISNNANELIDHLRYLLLIKDNQIWIEPSFQNIFSMVGYFEFFNYQNKYIIYKSESIFIPKYFSSKKNISKQFYDYLYWSLSSYYQLTRNNSNDFHFIHEKDFKNGFKKFNKIINSYGKTYNIGNNFKSSKYKVLNLENNSKHISLEKFLKSFNTFSKFKQIVLLQIIDLHYYCQNENLSLNQLLKISILKRPLLLLIEYKIISLINYSKISKYLKIKKRIAPYDLNKIIFMLVKQKLKIFLKKTIYYLVKFSKVIIKKLFIICEKLIKKLFIICEKLIKKLFIICKKLIKKTYLILKIVIDIKKIINDKFEFFNINKIKIIKTLSKNCDRDIVICTATDGRFNLIELQAKEIEVLIQSSNLTIEYCIAISSMEDVIKAEELKKKYKFINIELCQNKPLGYKWQSIINYVKNRYKPKSLFISGSDDFLTSKYILNMSIQCENLIGNKFTVIMPFYWKIFDEQTGNFYNLSYTPKQNISLGAGRVYSYGFLILCKWNLFDIYKNVTLDDEGSNMVKKYKALVNVIKPNFNQGSIISIKSKTRKELNTLKNILSANTIEYKNLNKKEIADLLIEINSHFCKKFFEKNK